MFKITATRAITWPELSIRKGENVYPSRKSVPAELWPKLARFRQLGLVAFDLKLGKDGMPEGEPDAIKVAELTERQLFDMSKDELAELAKANSITVKPAEGTEQPSKKQLIDALAALLPKPPAEPADVAKAPDQPNKRGTRKPQDEPGVSVGSS